VRHLACRARLVHTGKIREYKIVAGKSNVGQVACNSIVRLVVPHLEGFTGGHIRLHD
jgi:hypothetical protein